MKIFFCQELQLAIAEIRNADFLKKPEGFVAVFRKDEYLNDIVTDYISEPFHAKTKEDANSKYSSSTIVRVDERGLNFLIRTKERNSIAEYRKYAKKYSPHAVTTNEELKEALKRM